MTTQTNNRIVIGAVLAVSLGAIAWWISSSANWQVNGQAQSGSVKQEPITSLTAVPAYAPKLASKDRDADSVPSKFKIHADAVRQAVESNDYKIWRPSLLELLNPIYDRNEVIALLSSFLESHNLDVRVVAAEELFKLGSIAGKDALLSVVKAAANGEAISDQSLLIAISTLHNYRQTIDSGLLTSIYIKHPDLQLLKLLSLEQVPEAKVIVANIMTQNGFTAGYESEAGMLRMADARSLALFERAASSTNIATRLDANWALYRATGNQDNLDYIIAAAKEGAGVSPKTDKSGEWTGLDAMHYLEVITDPAVVQALREIADYGAKTANSGMLSGALVSLFYIQKDYQYVDQVILSFMKGNLDGHGIDGNMMFEIAAARNTPEIAAAAQARNQDAYERNFIQMKGRATEGILARYITSAIPSDVLIKRP